MKPLANMTDGDKIRAYRRMFRWMQKYAADAASLIAAKKEYFNINKIKGHNIPQSNCYLCAIEGSCSECLIKWYDWFCGSCDAEFGFLRDNWHALTIPQRQEKMLEISRLPRSK